MRGNLCTRLAAFGIGGVLAGCASNSGVFQGSPDTYRVATRAVGTRGGEPEHFAWFSQKRPNTVRNLTRCPTLFKSLTAMGTSKAVEWT
jgi:hypothetical protein